MGSLVHLPANGAIDGFIGAFPQPLLLHGRRLRGVITHGKESGLTGVEI